MRTFAALLALTAFASCGAEGRPFMPTSLAAPETADLDTTVALPEMNP